MGVPITDNIGLQGGQTLTIALWTLRRPYKTVGLDPTALIFLYCLSLRLPKDFIVFKISLISFSWLTWKFKVLVFFQLSQT